MELIFNELSVHGQFHDTTSFRRALGRIMSIRRMMRMFGKELSCHRDVSNAEVMSDRPLRAALGRLSVDQKKAVMSWLSKSGPFWDDYQQHAADDYLELERNGDVVTDSAVGEAAYLRLLDVDYRLVSMDPSSWLTTPLTVIRRNDDGRETERVGVPNYWDGTALRTDLESADPALESWADLENAARLRCPNLTFSKNSFEKLRGQPFKSGAASQMLTRLTVLQRLKTSFDQRDEYTSEGHAIRREHFTGSKAWFSDSSDSEKSHPKTRRDLTFPHPDRPGEYLFCPWHGKVKTPQLRVHFSWPVQVTEPLYVVYVGPKLTKR